MAIPAVQNGIRMAVMGQTGVGQQLSAMEVFYALLVNETAPPMVMPNVRIRDEPPGISLSTPALIADPAETGSAMATAPPIHDNPNVGALSRSNSLSALISVFVVSLTFSFA